MRAFVITVSFLLISSCVPYRPTFPTVKGKETESVYVMPVLQQTEFDVQIVRTYYSGVGYQFGVTGIVVAAILDGTIAAGRFEEAERKAEVIRAAAVDYDLIDNLKSAVEVEPAGIGWGVQETTEVTADTRIGRKVLEAFADRKVDTVIVLIASYRLTPSLDQLNVTLRQQIYPRASSASVAMPWPSSTRDLGYMSPKHPVLYRPFRDGEREQLRNEIAQAYEQAIAANPEREEKLRKNLAEELQDLDEATEIPENVAIAETWTPELLGKYLEQAKNHLRFMLEYDWNERVKPKFIIADMEEFDAVMEVGQATWRGLVVGTFDKMQFIAHPGAIFIRRNAPSSDIRGGVICVPFRL